MENDTDVVDRDYVHSAKQRLPEVVNKSDMINIHGDDDKLFKRDQRPIHNFFAVEKSMHQVVSEEMINWFATIRDFNNLIGEPVNRYRQEYKDMNKLKQLFFERVKNTPDMSKFMEFYKWF